MYSALGYAMAWNGEAGQGISLAIIPKAGLFMATVTFGVMLLEQSCEM